MMQTSPADAASQATAAVAEHVDKARDWATDLWAYCARLLAEYGFRFLGAMIVMLIAYVLAGWTRRAVLAALSGAHMEATIARFAANASRYAVLALGLMSCAPLIGINIAAFAALLGAGGLAVGLASQGALSNGAAGLMLLITRPFKSGDTIVVDGVSGIVEEVQIFSTMLNTPDNRRIFMPNNSIFGKVIENSTLNPKRATTFFTLVAADTDVEKMRASLTRACAGCAAVLEDPPPEVLLADLEGGGLKWSVTVWASTAQLKQARDQAIAAVRDALRDEKIAGPVPVTSIRLLDRPLPLPGPIPSDRQA
jgi:small conductance mechanosensitive channel